MDSDNAIPAALKAEDQWVCWRAETRNGTTTKVPVDPATGRYASVADPATWTDYDTAAAYAQDSTVDGLGFVFAQDDPYTGIDLDDCRDPATGTVNEWVLDVLFRLQSYTEISPSGTGYHIIVEGTVPAGGNRNGDLELYDHDRYFTVTGNHVPATPATVQHRDNALTALHQEYIADRASIDTLPEPGSIPDTDTELLEKARNAANSDKFEALWNGDTSNYPSHSEADQALCNILAFWTGGDEDRVERLFEKSGLVRDKWRDREDYRERTIRTAIRDCPAYYNPEPTTDQ